MAKSDRMSKIHVYPLEEEAIHCVMRGGADCYCEPDILDVGADDSGGPARVFVHQRLTTESGHMHERRVA